MVISTALSIVMEMENATTISWEEVGEVLRGLAQQIENWRAAKPGSDAELLLVHAGDEADNQTLELGIRREVPGLNSLARVKVLSAFGRRYYELKNVGIAAAMGSVIAFLDSDTQPEPGWLEDLLAPFEDPQIVAVNGHTYLGYQDFVSRTLALIWVFPLRDADDRAIRKRPLNANNCAFRANWLVPNPFPIDNGFKVSCTLQTRKVEASGMRIVRVPAYVRHVPLRGWRFLAWRAFVTGRDTDRRFAQFKSQNCLRRTWHAFGRWFTQTWRVLRRVLTKRHQVGMPLREVPGALMLGLGFHTLACLGQIGRAVIPGRDTPEVVPHYVGHS